MNNLEIRLAVKDNGLHLWQLADHLGMTDSTLSRKLRKELSPAEQQRYLSAVRQLAAQLKAGEAYAENENH